MMQRYQGQVPTGVVVQAIRTLASFSPIAGTLTTVEISTHVPNGNGATVFDVLKNGVSIYDSPTGRPSIASGASSVTQTGLTVATALGDLIEIRLASWPVGGFSGPAGCAVGVDDGVIPGIATVQEQDGSPSYNGATTMIVGNGDLTQPSPGQVRIQTMADALAFLLSGGLIKTSLLPALAINTVTPVANQAARLALAAERGDMAIQADNGIAYVLSTDSPTVNADWIALPQPTTLPPTGAAGGDLAGTYPNPTAAKVQGASIPTYTTDADKLRGVPTLRYNPLTGNFEWAYVGYFLSSTEIVNNFYLQGLGRAPTTTELNTQVAALDNARTEVSTFVAAMKTLGQTTIFGSAEYAGRGRTDTQFVNDLYAAFLGRLGDSTGISTWLANTTANGRTNTINAFAVSSEFLGWRIIPAWAGQLTGLDAGLLRGVMLAATAPTDGQAIVYNSANTRWQPGTPTIGSAAPSGAASGDLGGNYPAPTAEQLRGGRSLAGVPAPGTATFGDNFNDNFIDLTVWSTSGTVTEQNQRLELSTAGASAAWISRMNMSGHYVIFKTVQNADGNLRIFHDAGNTLYVDVRVQPVALGKVRLTTHNTGGDTHNDYSYAALADWAWLRVRHVASPAKWFLDSAPDVAGAPGTWTQRASADLPSGTNVSSCQVQIIETSGTFWIDQISSDVPVSDPIAALDKYKIAWDNANNRFKMQGGVGEFVTGALTSGSATALTNATAKNVITISLTAGDWDVWGIIDYVCTGATASDFKSGVSTVSATFGAADTFANLPLVITALSDTLGHVLVRVRLSLAVTTTVYLVAQSNFSAGTVSAYGTIRARRMTDI